MPQSHTKGKPPHPHSTQHSPHSPPHQHPLPHILLPLLPLTLSSLAPFLPGAAAAPFSPLDVYGPACGGVLADPPPGGWQPWSSTGTWGGSPVPGVGDKQGANVTIPCGQGVLLDVANVSLTVLDIWGALKFLDDPSVPLLRLDCAFVIVQGRLTIGTPQAQYSQRAEIHLHPNPNNRAHYLYTAREPADPAHPRDLGHKALAVVGGQLDLHGLPGPPSMLTWTRLASSARTGDVSLNVAGAELGGWRVGDSIVVAPTDFYPDQEDTGTIVGLTRTGAATWQMDLAAPLAWNHYAEPLGVADGFGGSIEERAEVGLLRRNIVVTSEDEGEPYALEGGHLMVYHTSTAQSIEGVHFLGLGQQGTLGRYSVHFHVCGDHSRSSVRKNLIQGSKQRCVVVHATHNLRVEANVAYNTAGHCFMVEEGGETGNTFIGNLGLRTRAVERLIPLSTNPALSEETDNQPATYWITNPNNNLIANAAAGSDDSGFWLELRFAVRGLSAIIPSLRNVVPIAVTPVGTFQANSAHSNLFAGYRAYPHGYYPRRNATLDNPGFWNDPVWVEMGGFNLWKNMEMGAFLHDTNHVIFSNCTLADNTWGIKVQEAQGVVLSGHRFVGQSSNYGNPRWCIYPLGSWACGPISGCSFPLGPGVPGRSVSWSGANKTIFGVVFDQNRIEEDGSMLNLLSSSTFSAYDATCHPSAALGIGSNRASYWNTGHSFTGLQFDSGANTNPVYVFPSLYVESQGTYYNGGEVASMVAVRDIDGSIVGSGGGYVVANNPALLPPNSNSNSNSSSSTNCTFLPMANAFACPGTCYRTVVFYFDEPSFSPYPSPADLRYVTDGARTLGMFSYLRVVRLADNSTLNLEGNLRQYGPMYTYPPSARIFSVSLLAGYTYDVFFIPPDAAPTFVPNLLTVKFADAGACQQGLTLRIKSLPGAPLSWKVQDDDLLSWKPCLGNAALLTPAVAPAQYSYVCAPASPSPLQALEIQFLPLFPAATDVTILPVPSPPSACTADARCGLTATRTVWQYNDSGKELHALYPGGPAFYNPLLDTSLGWKTGPGPLAYEGWNWSEIGTILQPTNWQNRTTYYFRANFSVVNSACVGSLGVDVLVEDGLVLYLNNVELLRVNMPAGPLSVSTFPVTRLSAVTSYGFNYTSFTLPLGTGAAYSLVEGLNFLAAEVHFSKDLGWDVAFGLRASAVASTGCTGPVKAAEVCDGVDNNADGLVDLDSVTKKPLTLPCTTACGTGIQTCIRGVYQNCTAPAPRTEVCNGKDDDCNGVVDDGPGQLNCRTGTVCFKGKCKPVQPLTKAVPVVAAQSPNWYMWDKGGNVPGSYPKWASAVGVPLSAWRIGSGAFGTYPANVSLKFSTALASRTSSGLPIRTRYFLKSFALSAADAAATWGFGVSVRRVDGAVAYANGVELVRTNMPSGAVTATTPALQAVWGTDPSWDQNAVSYYPSRPLRSSGAAAKAGTNWLGVELHSYADWVANFVFDAALTRYATQPCPAKTDCVRYPPLDSLLLPKGSSWKYLDASLAPPPSNWASPALNDNNWPAGPAPLGNGSWWNIPTKIMYGSDLNNGRQTYYFRASFTALDGPCYYNLTLSVLGNDGVVVYINGVEAIRNNMPAGPITAYTPAAWWPTWQYVDKSIGGAWLKAGVNVVAVELHQSTYTSGNYVFDLGLVGRREGGACKPLPT